MQRCRWDNFKYSEGGPVWKSWRDTDNWCRCNVARPPTRSYGWRVFRRFQVSSAKVEIKSMRPNAKRNPHGKVLLLFYHPLFLFLCYFFRSFAFKNYLSIWFIYHFILSHPVFLSVFPISLFSHIIHLHVQVSRP